MRIRTAVVLFGLVALLGPPLGGPAVAQQTQNRSEVELLPVGPPPEELEPRPWGLFDTHLTLEIGGQIANIHGNNEVYRSHLNYSDGFRVFSFNFRGEAREDTFLTDFYVQGAGWGGDPSNWVRWGFSKDKWFDFRAHYRRNDYFWVFPGFARNQHFHDQERRWQTYDLTILPQRPLRFKLGYRRNSSFATSPGGTVTTSDVEGTREVFFFFEPLRQTYDEYRLGVEWHPKGWNFFLEQGYRFFRNDREVALPELFNPANPAEGNFGVPDPALLNDQFRLYPIRARVPFTRLTINGRPHKTLEVVGHAVYSRTKSTHSRFEFVDGVQYTGAPLTNTFFSAGNANRPMTRVNLGATWRPIPKFTLSESFSFHRYDITGGDVTNIVGTLANTFDLGHLLDVDTFTNRIEGRYDFTHWIGVRAGFLFTHRDIKMAEFEFGLPPDEEELNTNNRIFLAGFLFRPQRTVNVSLDLERGNYTGVFTRLSPANIDRIRLRGRWKPVEGVHLAASWFIFDNTNSNLPTAFNPDGAHRARNRGFSLDFQLTRFQRGYLNVGYSRNDVTTITDVILPRFGPPNGGVIEYIANDNYVYIDFGGRISGNLYGDAGYRVSFTTGTFPPSDPVGTCTPFFGLCDNTGGLAPLLVNPFDWGGLNFHQPHAALRYALNDNVNWKAGWRWYGYNIKHGSLSDYKAHIVTTSVVLSF